MPTLTGLLQDKRGATFIGFSAETEPDMNKRGNPYYGKVKKVAHHGGQINFWYDEAVLRQLAREGRDASCFMAGESWHTPVLRDDGTLTPFCQHKTNGKLYLRFRSLSVSDVRYINDQDGTEIPLESIKPWLREKSSYENQGTEVKIRFLVFKLESIKTLVLDNVTYVLDTTDAAQAVTDLVLGELRNQTQPAR
jgi:hypothetical protein